MREALVGLIVGLIAVPVLSIPLWFAVAVGSDVDRARVARFAARQRLEITVHNGQQVIGYLATTRRWRAFGLAAGLVVSVAWFLPDRVSVQFLHLFAGWFVGALIAELRVAHLPRGQTRAALIAPRKPEDYLNLPARLLLPMATALCLIVGAFTADLLWTVAGVAIAVIVWLIQRRVLRRPQPVAAPDQLAADDAIRSRSLHVLAAGGMTLVSYCIGAQVGGGGIGVLFYVVVPLAGYLVATNGWRVARVH